MVLSDQSVIMGGMLVELHIANLGVIEDVTLDFASGLNVLTGETGAGKTMVVSAVELLLGARADADRVGGGAASALVEGRLVPPPAGAEEWLGDGDDELVICREVAAEAGRSRARIGGRLAPASALATCVGGVIELHGQSESARLVAPAVQRALLDRAGGPVLAAVLDDYRMAYQGWRQASDELEALRDSQRDRLRELDRLRYELGEIDEVAPTDDEDSSLEAELRRLEHAESLVGAAAAGAAAVTGEGGARDTLGAALAALRGEAGVDAELDALLERVAGLAAEAQELGFDLTSYAEELELDPARLEVLRDRHAALVRLTRKYGQAASGQIDVTGVRAYADLARARLSALEGGDVRAGELSAQVTALAANLETAAQRLRDGRRTAGQRLVLAVEEHLADLAMGAARMQVVVEEVAPATHGADRVTFLLTADPGQPALPVGKGASGGERSRVALALRLALADADDTPVLVFDEVDAGIGGATALAVGRKLAQLARGRQVLCVTHLAQLAAHADAHFVVTKAAGGDRVRATVRRLEEPQRITELSRMLSGSVDSVAAAEHAAEMRANALAERSP
jgi:DNA repair protein RecN (Recombination protein N)